MKNFILYTDGACSGNPGPGGWGAIIDNMGVKTELSGGEPNTTNNRMELTAVIKSLHAIVPMSTDIGEFTKINIDLFSDSKYVLDALRNGWAKNWQKNNWRKSDGKPALNSDLWSELLLLIGLFDNVTYHWVKGHADNPMNNRCDELAVAEWQKIKTAAEATVEPIDVNYQTVDMTNVAAQLNADTQAKYREELSGGLDRLVMFTLNHDMLNDMNAREAVINRAKELGINMTQYCPVCGEKIKN